MNGRYRGQSPVTIPLSPDIDYEIGLSKAGYGSTNRRVRLEAAASREIEVDLTARVGEVTVAVLPDDATVYVDGQARGSGSVTLNLSSAPHRLEVKKGGYASFARSVTPRPGYPQTIQVRLLSDAEVTAAQYREFDDDLTGSGTAPCRGRLVHYGHVATRAGQAGQRSAVAGDTDESRSTSAPKK